MARGPHDLPKPLRIMRHHIRLCIAAVLGTIAAIVLPGTTRLSTRLLIGWDLGAAAYLVQAFAVIPRFDIKRVQIRAEQQDEGALLILMLTVGAAMASLAAIVIELGAAHKEHTNVSTTFALAAITITLSWTLIHVIFAFHYAHEFYREPGDRGSGLVFPQDDWPDYWDFLYFSFVIGMTFQVSDVQVTRKRLRRIVVAHGVVSFIFSVAILALAVNLGAGLV